MKLKLLSALLLGTVAIPVAHAQVSQVAYAGLTGTQLVTFDDIAGGGAPGTNYDTVFYSNGVGFAERFAGQVRTSLGDSDQLSGSPVGALSLAVGAAGQNLNVFAYNPSQVLTGLGPKAFPNFDAIGEGAFAALFSSDQSQFGFQLVGGGGGNANISFFRADGSLIQAIVVGGLADTFYGFQRDGGINDIRGISIWNDDSGGIGFDNLKFDVRSTGGGAVPEPAAWAMMLAGFGLIGAAMRRRRTVTAFA
jgi:PEP-CTERM motif